MLVGAALAGCAGEPPNTDELAERPSDPIQIAMSDASNEAADVDARVLAEDARCEPMADDGPCSLVCDPDALVEHYVPSGTCIHFVCTARDGSSHHLGACR